MRNGPSIDHRANALPPLAAGRLAKQLGERIASRRTALSLGRDQLADILRIAPAELEQFESGTRRMTALEVFDMAQPLGVPIGFFYAEPSTAAVAEPDFHQYPELPESARPRRSESTDLLTNFQQVEDIAVRSCILDFVRSLVPREAVDTAFGQDNEQVPEQGRGSRFEGLAEAVRSGSVRAVPSGP